MPQKPNVKELTIKCISLAVKLSIRKKLDYPQFYTYIMVNIFGEKERGYAPPPIDKQMFLLKKIFTRLESMDRISGEAIQCSVPVTVPAAPVRKALF